MPYVAGTHTQFLQKTQWPSRRIKENTACIHLPSLFQLQCSKETSIPGQFELQLLNEFTNSTSDLIITCCIFPAKDTHYVLPPPAPCHFRNSFILRSLCQYGTKTLSESQLS